MEFIIEHAEHVEMNFDFKKPLLCTGLEYVRHPCTPEEDVLYEIECLCEYRMVSGIEQWLVQWKGYEEKTWERGESLYGNDPELDAEMEEWKKKSCSEMVPCSIPSEKDMIYEIEALLEYNNWYGEESWLVKWKGYEKTTWEKRDTLYKFVGMEKKMWDLAKKDWSKTASYWADISEESCEAEAERQNLRPKKQKWTFGDENTSDSYQVQSADRKRCGRRPPQIPIGDTRLTEYKKRDRVYICDRCSAKVTFNNKATWFSGAYVAFKSIKEARLKFEDMQNAWENGFDFTWYCDDCHSASGTLEESKMHVHQNIQYRTVRAEWWEAKRRR